MEATLIPLQQMYLMALQQCAAADHLSTILQDTGNDTGRLWFVPDGSTVPHLQIVFKFSLDAVTIAAVHRDQRELVREVKYAEGLDGFLEQFQRFMRANRLAAPAARRAPTALRGAA